MTDKDAQPTPPPSPSEALETAITNYLNALPPTYTMQDYLHLHSRRQVREAIIWAIGLGRNLEIGDRWVQDMASFLPKKTND